MLCTVTVAPGLTEAGVVNVKSLIVIGVSDPPAAAPDPAAEAVEPDAAPADEPEQPASAARTIAQRHATTACRCPLAEPWILDMRLPAFRRRNGSVSSRGSRAGRRWTGARGGRRGRAGLPGRP